MALIQCPECNGNISNSVRQCIHCGSPITVCKECNTVYAGNPDICACCGFVFVEKASSNSPSKAISDTIQRWASNNLFRKHYLSNDIISSLMTATAVLLWIVSIVRLFVWRTTSDAFGTNDAQTVAYTLCILASFFMVASTFLEKFRLYYYPLKFGEWACANGINTIDLVLTYMNSDFSKMILEDIQTQSTQARDMIRSNLIENNILYQQKRKNDIVLSSLFSLTEYVLFTILVLRGIDGFIAYVWFEDGSFILDSLITISDNNFFWENIWLVVAWIAVLIIESFYEQKSEKTERAFLYDWMIANMPEHKEIYEKHICDLEKFILEESQKK